MIKFNSKNWSYINIVLAIVTSLLFYLIAEFSVEYQSAKTVATIAILMSILWMTEAMPISATSLIPLILFPLTGTISGKQAAEAYMNSTIFLFLGGFIIAIAMEKWNLHKRIALNVINLFGNTPSLMILGFMIAAAFISMWISNTATAVMLLPIGIAIISKMELSFGREDTKTFSIALMLGIAYACSIGGISTLIGTPPNLVFQRIYKISFPDQPEMLFGDWMKFALPISITMLGICWALLTKIIYPPDKRLILDKNLIKNEKELLGKMSFEEKAVALVFITTSLLWIFRVELDLGIISIPGWSAIFPKSDFIDDGTVAITMGILLFLIPAKSNTENKFLLNAESIKSIPWDIILLFGGGFALADGFVASQLSKLIGAQFASLQGIHIFLIIIAVAFVVTFLTELTSNTATAQILLPILAALSIQLEINPYLLMIPATISASFAFMLPVGTPPNAIVFSSQRVRIFDMSKAGIFLNIIGIIITSIFVWIFFG